MTETQTLFISFLKNHQTETDRISVLLKKRIFTEDKDLVKNFLDQAGNLLLDYEKLDDSNLKRLFLKSLADAWEFADAGNSFNPGKLAGVFQKIIRFSKLRFEEICEANGHPENTDLLISEKEPEIYWQEIIRTSLISIGEDYRRQSDLEECQKKLDRLFLFIEKNLKPSENYRPHIILAQCHYFSAKVARFQGNFYKSEKELIAACQNFRDEVFLLSKNKEAERDYKLDEIQLRSGILEVSHAWFYFSQGHYESAVHTALNALLMLAGSKDRITQLHAELVIAAAKRATAKNIGDLIEVIEEFKRLSDKFHSYNHSRLKVKADYEYVLSLIMLDSLIEDPSNSRISETYKDPLALASETLVRYQNKNKFSRRWTSHLETLESRYLRRLELKKSITVRNFQNALNIAGKAYRTATELNNLLCRVEALISQGEIHFQMYKSAKHKQDVKPSDILQRVATIFEEADQLCSDLCKEGGFPELHGIVKLYLARTAICDSRYGLAKRYFDEFRTFKKVEHAWLHRLEKKVRLEYEQSESEILQIDSPILSEMLKKLYPLLIKKAENTFRSKEKPSEEKISEVIGISRVTLKRWRQSVEDNR